MVIAEHVAAPAMHVGCDRRHVVIQFIIGERALALSVALVYLLFFNASTV